MTSMNQRCLAHSRVSGRPSGYALPGMASPNAAVPHLTESARLQKAAEVPKD